MVTRADQEADQCHSTLYTIHYTLTTASGDRASLTNYNSITVSPELRLTSANRYTQYGNVSIISSIAYIIRRIIPNQRTDTDVIAVNPCLCGKLVINQGPVSSRAVLGKS